MTTTHRTYRVVDITQPYKEFHTTDFINPEKKNVLQLEKPTGKQFWLEVVDHHFSESGDFVKTTLVKRAYLSKEEFQQDYMDNPKAKEEGQIFKGGECFTSGRFVYSKVKLVKELEAKESLEQEEKK
jgi:hypothetical protein